jgi:hypothetical protein
MSRQSAIQHSQYVATGRGRLILNFASSLQRGKRMQLRKHVATNARRLAFLALQQVTSAHLRWSRLRDSAKTQGRKTHLPEPDVQHYLDTYLAACEHQKRVKGN